MIKEKLINKYLIYLYDDYTSQHGDSLLHLDKSGELTFGTEFAGKNPEAISHLDENIIENLALTLAKELEIRGFAKTDSVSVYLTKEGILEAKRLKAPITSFLKLHWKWFVVRAFAFVAIILTIIKLINF